MALQQPLCHALPATAQIPISYVDGWIYTVPVSLGTPPLGFIAALDLAWSDMFVPSIRCDNPVNCDLHPLYNHSASSTFLPDGRNTSIHHYGFWTNGNAASDTLQVGGIEIPRQTFEEAYDFRPTYFFDDSWYDTAFGLSRETVRLDWYSNLQAPSPFQNMVQNGLLNRNVFTLTLPRSAQETGRLLLGDGRLADVTSAVLPMVPPRIVPFSGGWEVEAVSLSFGSFHFPLDGYTALFSTIEPHFLLPEIFTDYVQSYIPTGNLGTVNCSMKHADLPNITVTLRGKGTTFDFEFTPEDYVADDLKLPYLDPVLCTVPIFHGGFEEDMKFIHLGSKFLVHFDSVFDAAEGTITLHERWPCRQCSTRSNHDITIVQEFLLALKLNRS